MSDNNGQTNNYPMMQVMARNPLMASTISKAIEQPRNTGASTIRSAETGAMASMGEMFNISRTVQQEIQNYESFFQLFPDMNIERFIVIGGVLAPNNMFREDLNYSLDSNFIDSILAGKIIKVIQERVDKTYGFIHDLREIVDNALFNRGSHVKVILPESAVDHIINSGGLEATFRTEGANGYNKLIEKAPFSLGLLGNKRADGVPRARFESYGNSVKGYEPAFVPSSKWDAYPDMKKLVEGNQFFITDDSSILKKPQATQEVIKEVVRSRIDAQRKVVQRLRTESAAGVTSSASLNPKDRVMSIKDEDSGSINIDRLRSAVFKEAPTAQALFARVPRLSNLKRHSIGSCLSIDAPSEAFIPVHYPGNPRHHLGYFALLDPSSGYFISLETQRNFMQGLSDNGMNQASNTSSSGGNQTLASSLTAKAKQNLVSSDNTTPLRYHPEIFGTLMVEDYLERLANGTLGFQAEAAMSNTIAYVMMARANAGKQTQVLYLPAEYVSYFAFDFNSNGTGRSMLAGVTNLLSLRAAALYARVGNQIRNAISITDVKVTLDERDHQPQRTLSKIVDLVSQSRAQFFPWGLNTASDIWAWWNRAGYQLNVEGHPAIPKTKIEYEHRKHDHNVPDIADDSYLADMVGHHFGITPEMKDAGKGADFATSITNNNIMFAKRSHGLQLVLNPQITQHIRRIVYNDSEIFADVRKIIKENWSEIISRLDDADKATYADVDNSDDAIDTFMRHVIDSVEVKLPPPEVTTIQNQSQAFSDFSDAIDTAFDAILKDEALSTTIFGDQMAMSIEQLLTAKAQLKRDWMNKSGYLQELFDLASTDDDGKPNSKLLLSSAEFTTNLGKNLIQAMERYKATGAALQKDIGILNGSVEPDVVNPDQPLEGGTIPTEDQGQIDPV